MQIIAQSNNIQYQVLDLTLLNQATKLVATCFCTMEPMTVCQNISVDSFSQFLELLADKVVQQQLSIAAIDKTSQQLVGAVIADDFASATDEELVGVSDQFLPIFALLEQLDQLYQNNKSIYPGDYLHIFMLAVDQAQNNKKIGYQLIKACLANALNKGYKVAFAEATGLVSQHLFLNKFQFKHCFQINYKDFNFNGQPVFKHIKNHQATILVEKFLN